MTLEKLLDCTKKGYKYQERSIVGVNAITSVRIIMGKCTMSEGMEPVKSNFHMLGHLAVNKIVKGLWPMSKKCRHRASKSNW